MNRISINNPLIKSLANNIILPKTKGNDDSLSSENTLNNDILEISDNARKRLKRQETMPSKKSGEVSAREIWEDELYKEKNSRYITPAGTLDSYELFREDSPDLYAKYMDYVDNLNEHIIQDGLEAAVKECYNQELAEIPSRWTRLKLMERPDYFLNPSSPKSDIINYLEYSFSDSIHNVSFDFFSEKYGNEYDIWRFSAKYCVQFTDTVYRNLISADNQQQKDVLNVIDKCITEMKNADKFYEGNKTALRFGIKIRDDLSVSYHAKYGGGAYNMNNFSADSIEELIKKIMD